jgi:hypothetical protein
MSKKILSIDVGIKNLAFCLFSINEQNVSTILLWDVINLSQKLDIKCCELAAKSNQPCNSPAKFTKLGKCYCLKHGKKHPTFKIADKELKTQSIKKLKISNLTELAAKYEIPVGKPLTKASLVSLFSQYLDTHFLDPIEAINASKLDLVTIGRNMMISFDEILAEHLSSIDIVIIENQISPIANRMKTIQGMISQYFIMRNSVLNIEFISSINKLKDCVKLKEKNEGVKTEKEEKMNYSDRKKIGIQYCLELISNTSWIPFFTNHSKKDDLADAYLQGNWFIRNKIMK